MKQFKNLCVGNKSYQHKKLMTAHTGVFKVNSKNCLEPKNLLHVFHIKYDRYCDVENFCLNAS